MSARARGFSVTPYGVRLAVVSESDTMAELLARFVLPWLPRAAIGETVAARVVEVRRAGAGFDVRVDGAVAGEVSSPEAAVVVAQRVLDEAVVQGQTDFAVVHCGVVAKDGRAILLPGSTGAGKSTLVAELVRRGAPYFSDEYAFVDPDGLVHPYPRPLLLRDGSGGCPVLASELGGTVARQPIRVGLIIEMRRAGDATLTLTPVSQGEGVLILLRNTPQALVDRPWILAPLERAVEHAACYVGVRGDAPATADCLLREF